MNVSTGAATMTPGTSWGAAKFPRHPAFFPLYLDCSRHLGYSLSQYWPGACLMAHTDHVLLHTHVAFLLMMLLLSLLLFLLLSSN